MTPYLKTAMEISVVLVLVVITAIASAISGGSWWVRMSGHMVVLIVGCIVGYRAGQRRYA